MEDINALIVNTLNRCMPGLGLDTSDIDRAHRLPGGNNRVIVKFVRTGQDSARDRVMSRRLELKGKDLYVNESLTKLRGLIFRSLLAAKRAGKIHSVHALRERVPQREAVRCVHARGLAAEAARAGTPGSGALRFGESVTAYHA